MKSYSYLLLCLMGFFLVLNPGYIFPQTGFGSLQGSVVDSMTKDPLPFAPVIIYMNGIQKGAVLTDIYGNYVIKPIPAGAYDIKVTFMGYYGQRITGFIISSDMVSFQDFELVSTIIEKPPVEIKGYKDPLLKKDPSGAHLTSETIRRVSAKKLTDLINLTPGVYENSFRAGRTSGTAYYLDGKRVSGGLGVPRSAMAEINTMTGGIPAEYGDLTGGIVNIITKGASNRFQGGLELVSSQLTDPFGYNMAEGNLSGPILLKNKKYRRTDSAETILGFLLSGNFTYIKDPIQNATGFWKIKDDVYDYLYQNPISRAPGGTGFIPSSELVTIENMEHVKVHPGIPTYSYDLFGKLDYQPVDNLEIIFSGTVSSGKAHGYNYSQSMFNYKEAAKYVSFNNTLSASLQLLHRLKFRGTGSTGKEFSGKKASLTNAFYTLSFDYTKQYNYGWHEDHKKNYFEYGYLGKFERYQEPVYTNNYDTVNGKIVKANLLTGYRDTLVTFEPSGLNEGTANYTNQLFNLNQGKIANFNEIKQSGGLWNGDAPQNVYSLWTNISTPAANFNMAEGDVFAVKGQASADFKSNSFKIGFEYEQRIIRSYSVAGAGIWTVMRQLTNAHLLQLDIQNPEPVYSEDGIFLDTINYRRLNDGTQTTFDRNLRNYLKSIHAKDVYGNPIDDYSYINIDRYSPEYFDLSFFSPEECLKNGIVTYIGYDYLGNKLKRKPSIDDFLKSDQKLIAPYSPIYMAGYVQDQIVYNHVIFRFGLRADRFDANQPVLKDKYSLYPVKTVSEVSEFKHPSNIGNDYVVYGDDPFNPTRVVGYRNGDHWYDENGAEVVDPAILALQTTSGKIAPFLVEKNADQLKLVSESFRDYKPQVNLSPRIYLAFPISERASLFANYDIRVQRPDAGLFASIDDYYYLEERGTSMLNNAALEPQQITGYEVGLKQMVSRNSAITVNAYYNETRKQINVRMINQAYPRSYMTYDNIDFQTTKGISLSYDYRKIEKINNLSFLINYTLQFANGTGSNAASQAGLISAGQPNLRTPLPLDNDYRHIISANIDYRYRFGEFYKGYVTKNGKKLFEGMGANFTVTATSGKPYSRQSNVTETMGIGIRQSEVLKGTVNGSRYPWSFNVNMQIDRDFLLKINKSKKSKKSRENGIAVNVYVLVQNLFNISNIAYVYRYTGTPDDDGFLASSYGVAAMQQATYAKAFADQYAVKVNNPGNYSTPRLIRIGTILSF